MCSVWREESGLAYSNYVYAHLFLLVGIYMPARAVFIRFAWLILFLIFCLDIHKRSMAKTVVVVTGYILGPPRTVDKKQFPSGNKTKTQTVN